MSRTRARTSSSRSASIQRTVRIGAITILFLIGRLKDGTTLTAAKAELETLLAAWPSSVSRPVSNTNGPHTPDPQRHRLRFDPLQDQIVGGAKAAVLVLQGAVVLVLLIACANIANLLLARAEARHKEFAVRAAIGAGARQLIAPFVAEGVILTAVRYRAWAPGRSIRPADASHRVSRQPAAIGRRLARSSRAGLHADRRQCVRRDVFAHAAGALVVEWGSGFAQRTRDGRRIAQSDSTRAGRVRSGAGRGAGYRRWAAAPHRAQPVARRCRIQPRSTRHVWHQLATRLLRETRADHGISPAPARCASCRRPA